MKLILASLFLIFSIAFCRGQDSALAKLTLDPQLFSNPYGLVPDPSLQISHYIPRIFQDRKGNFWFGTGEDGVCRWNGKSFTYFKSKDGFPGRSVRGILQDEDGTLWFATEAGIIRYDGKSFSGLTVRDGLINDDVWSMVKDKKGIFWLGTAGGVCRYDGKVFSDFPIPLTDVDYSDCPSDYRSPGLVWSILEDKTGNLWFGTNGAGVIRYNGSSFSHFTRKNGLPNNNVKCILEDRSGVLWAGTSGGLARFNVQPFSSTQPGITQFTKRDGLCDNDIRTMLEDKSGRLWLGTGGGGASRFDGKTFTTFTEESDLTRNHVQSIMQDREGSLWFGFSGGVFRFDGKSFRNFTKRDGC